MIRKVKTFFACLGMCALMTSCVPKITSPVMTTEAEVGDKVGKSSYTTILGIGFDRSRSIAEAVKNGNIKRISTVDVSYDGGLTQTYTTIVTGQ